MRLRTESLGQKERSLGCRSFCVASIFVYKRGNMYYMQNITLIIYNLQEASIMKNIKDKIKGFIAGTIVCSLLCGTIAFAASTKIDVVFESIRYMFDGIEKKPTDAKGFVYKGTVYAPISFIGSSFGKDVTYDGKTKTLWVGKKTGSYKYLDSINYARKDSSESSNDINFIKWDSGSNFIIADNTFQHGIGAEFSQYFGKNTLQSIDYNLNGTYKTLTGKFGIDDSTKNNVGYGKVKIIGDGEELYASDNLLGGDLPRDLNVDITGVLRLQIKFEVSGNGTPSIVLGDAKLIQ
jgi:hypothetical protein